MEIYNNRNTTFALFKKKKSKHYSRVRKKQAEQAGRGKTGCQKKLIAILSESSAGSNSCPYVTQSGPETRTHSAWAHPQTGFKVDKSFGIFPARR